MSNEGFFQDDDGALWGARERAERDAKTQAEAINRARADAAARAANPPIVQRGGSSFINGREVQQLTGGVADRFNDGKPQLSYVPAEQMRAVARALTYGAVKYERDNYRKGFPIASLCDSLLRHTFALLAGETHDPESGLHHVDMINANAGFLAVGIEADWPMYEEKKNGNK